MKKVDTNDVTSMLTCNSGNNVFFKYWLSTIFLGNLGV